MSKKIEEYLSSVGLNFPENEKELSAFNQTNEEYDYLLDEDLIDPVKILNDIKHENLNKTKGDKLTKSQSYFRRIVLAAKIVSEYHEEARFGTVKFQKMVYLCEQVSKMNFHTNYSKQAAGPFDNRFMHSVRTAFQNQGWFRSEKIDEGKYKKIKFYPLDKLDSYEKYFDDYFGNVNSEIEFLINIFRRELTWDVELVATIFSCWEEINEEKIIFSDRLVVQKVYSWHPEKKKKFTEDEILKKIEWMRDNGIYPRH